MTPLWKIKFMNWAPLRPHPVTVSRAVRKIEKDRKKYRVVNCRLLAQSDGNFAWADTEL